MANPLLHHAPIRWYLWLFPLFALVLSGYLLFHTFLVHHHIIKITFEDVSNIEPEKTRVRYHGVEVGIVKQVEFAPDKKNIVVEVAINKGDEFFSVEGSKFWIVTPQVSLQGMKGLDTIFTGPYIEALPGPADGERQTEFKGRHDSENQPPAESTTSYIIETPSAESISTGDAVTYRGLTVGDTGKLILSKTGQVVEVQINIQNKYVRLVRANSVFWRRVGIQANLGLFGSDIKVNSLDSIMHGGVEFATPDAAAGVAKAGTHFALAPGAPKHYNEWKPNLENEHETVTTRMRTSMR